MSVVTSQRDVQLRFCYAPGFSVQTDILTALANAAITGTFQATLRSEPELARRLDRIMDCSGQYPVDEQTVTRLSRWNLEFDVDAQSLGWVAAGAMGAAGAPVGGSPPYTSALSMLGKNVFLQPYTTLILQNQGSGSGPGAMLVGAVVNRFTLTAKAAERVKVSTEIISRWPVAASGFTAPACSPITPLRLNQGLFTYDGTDSLNAQSGSPHTITEQIILDYDNGTIIDENAFPAGNIEAQIFERSDVVKVSFAWMVQGEFFDSLHAASLGTPGSVPEQGFHAIVFRVGPSTNGVTFTAPHAMLTTPDRSITYEGKAKRSMLNLMLTPTLGSDGTTLPMTASVVSPNPLGFMQ